MRTSPTSFLMWTVLAVRFRDHIYFFTCMSSILHYWVHSHCWQFAFRLKQNLFSYWSRARCCHLARVIIKDKSKLESAETFSHLSFEMWRAVMTVRPHPLAGPAHISTVLLTLLCGKWTFMISDLLPASVALKRPRIALRKAGGKSLQSGWEIKSTPPSSTLYPLSHTAAHTCILCVLLMLCINMSQFHISTCCRVYI